MSTSSLSNNSLNSSNGTFTSNSSLNSTPSVDRYAALKDLDEQLREAKTETPTPVEQPNPQGIYKIQFYKLILINFLPLNHVAKPINPFNPFQAVPSPQQQHPPQQQSYQNWTFPTESQTNFTGFGSPGSNGFFYTSNMTNGIIAQQSPFGGKAVFGNPFMVS
jgi:Arf-GAP domain and FG repeat-containing protein 1